MFLCFEAHRNLSLRSLGMNLTSALLLIAGGVAAGFINTIAGSGSLITLP